MDGLGQTPEFGAQKLHCYLKVQLVLRQQQRFPIHIDVVAVRALH